MGFFDRWGEREGMASEVAGSSPRHERLASVSFGRNTDRLSKRHEATAKTNLKCLLTKQSELAALPAHGGKLAGSRPVYSSLWPLSCALPSSSSFAIVSEGVHPYRPMLSSRISFLPISFLSIPLIKIESLCVRET